MRVELTSEEVDILLAWAEEATSPLVGVGTVFLTRAESVLLEKLRRAREDSAHEAEFVVTDRGRQGDGSSDY